MKTELIPARIVRYVHGEPVYSKVDEDMNDLTHENCEGYLLHISHTEFIPK